MASLDVRATETMGAVRAFVPEAGGGVGPAAIETYRQDGVVRLRAALSLNFTGDDVTYFDMPGESDPPDRGEGLVEGGPITCESFPVLRSR